MVQGRRSKAALALTAVAALGGGGAALAHAAGPSAGAARAHTVRLKADRTALAFNVSRITVRHGRVTLRMANPSGQPHAIAVEGHGIDRDGRTVGKGGTSVVTVALRKGRYAFYCPVPGHKAAGMKGTLVVR